MAANNPAFTNKARLHVEVEIKREHDTEFLRLDRVCNEVVLWIVKNFVQLRIGQDLTDDMLDLDQSLGCFVRSIKVVDYTGRDFDEPYYQVNNVQLDVQAYELYEGDNEEDRASGAHAGNDFPQMTVTRLPHRTMNGIYEALVFSEQIPSELLRIITTMVYLMKKPNLNPAVVFWNHLILLHGPPGSGKTSLAKALAQKLTIRLSNQYSKSKLVQINSHTLMSKYFGESSKLVGKMFNTIHAMTEEEMTLVIVLIDEVETLTSCRQKAANGSECGDAIRVTNQVLTALDRFRHRTNAMVICTSNLKDSLDAAFLDRVDLDREIPPPNTECVYEIFRSSLNEMIRCNMLTVQPSPDDNATFLHDTAAYHVPLASCSTDSNGSHYSEGACPELVNSSKRGAAEGLGAGPASDPLPGSPSASSFEHISTPSSSNLDDSLQGMAFIPDLAYVNLKLWNRPRSMGRKLLSIACEAKGMSGRTLRRLPFVALAKYMVVEPYTVHEALTSLSKIVDEEVRKKAQENAVDTMDVLPDIGCL